MMYIIYSIYYLYYYYLSVDFIHEYLVREIRFNCTSAIRSLMKTFYYFKTLTLIASKVLSYLFLITFTFVYSLNTPNKYV